jgi:hypothetical protein
LLALSVLFLVSLKINNEHLWFFTDMAAIVIATSSGLILLLKKK